MLPPHRSFKGRYFGASIWKQRLRQSLCATKYGQTSVILMSTERINLPCRTRVCDLPRAVRGMTASQYRPTGVGPDQIEVDCTDCEAHVYRKMGSSGVPATLGTPRGPRKAGVQVTVHKKVKKDCTLSSVDRLAGFRSMCQLCNRRVRAERSVPARYCDGRVHCLVGFCLPALWL